MRALRIVFASAALLTVSAFAADTQVKPSAQGTTPNIVVASAEKQVNVKQATRVAKTGLISDTQRSVALRVTEYPAGLRCPISGQQRGGARQERLIDTEIVAVIGGAGSSGCAGKVGGCVGVALLQVIDFAESEFRCRIGGISC